MEMKNPKNGGKMDKSIFTMLMRDRESLYDAIFSKESVGKIILVLALISVFLFGIYGIVMGFYNSFLQSLSSSIKLPVLFFLSLLICYPAMFVFNILLGSKLNFSQSLAMILSSYALTSCVLVSFAPISLFFMLIGSSYAFLRLLHVTILGIAGLSGMFVLNTGLKYACEKHSVYPRQGVTVFKVWVIIFAFVGTQLAWNLRPFIGNREQPFQILRKQESNFYAHMLHTTFEFLVGTLGSGNKKQVKKQQKSAPLSKSTDSSLSIVPISFQKTVAGSGEHRDEK